MNEFFSISCINTNDSLYSGVFALREKILRQPIGLSLYQEDTTDDVSNQVFVAHQGHQVVGCLMAKPKQSAVLKLRQMAIDSHCQGQGIGQKLVLVAEEYARQNAVVKIELHARKSALGFYEKLGYQPVGVEFVEVGIPHIAMEKFL